jgi:hypothetical protein
MAITTQVCIDRISTFWKEIEVFQNHKISQMVKSVVNSKKVFGRINKPDAIDQAIDTHDIAHRCYKAPWCYFIDGPCRSAGESTEKEQSGKGSLEAVARGMAFGSLNQSFEMESDEALRR